jgi:hypothetical protein
VSIAYRIASDHTVVLGPKVADQIWITEDESGTTANLFYIGTSLGYVFEITDGIRIAPECAVAAPVVESVPGFGIDVGSVHFSCRAAWPSCSAVDAR